MAQTPKKLVHSIVDSALDNDERKPIPAELQEKMKLPELKRAQSVKEMIKSYQRQKSTIREALCNLDKKPKNKIIFDDNYNSEQDKMYEVELGETKKKKPLLQSDDEEDSFNFELKEQFDGEQGQQLFELQSKFKGDKRFKLDERFIENGEDEEVENSGENMEILLEEEKRNEIDILEQVLGTRIKSNISGTQQKRAHEKKMLRYDPTQSEHTQYEIKTPRNETKKKSKDHLEEKNSQNIEYEEVQQPVVSKDVFYKVSDDLKKTFEEQQTFSLLNLFSKSVEEERQEEQNEQAEIIDKKNKLYSERNPFRYDSSEDEEVVEEGHCQDAKPSDQKVNTTRFISEPFFFKDNDFRYQEGSDFVKRVASERTEEFEEQRRNLKHIVKSKVRNNQRKNNPFKKQLGGNKRKKLLKIKRALQR